MDDMLLQENKSNKVVIYIYKICLGCSVNKVHFFILIISESYPRCYLKNKTKPLIQCIMFGVFMYILKPLIIFCCPKLERSRCNLSVMFDFKYWCFQALF